MKCRQTKLEPRTRVLKTQQFTALIFEHYFAKLSQGFGENMVTSYALTKPTICMELNHC
jgi:hypothetical protein